VAEIERDQIDYQKCGHEPELGLRADTVSQCHHKRDRNGDRTPECKRLDGRNAETTELANTLYR